MFGNMGQIFFDLRADVQRLSNFLSDNLSESLQRLTTLSNDTKATQDILTQGFSTLNQDLKTQLHTQAASLIKTLQEIEVSLSTGTKATQDILSQGFSSLSEEVKTQLHTQAASLIKTLREIEESVSGDLQALLKTSTDLSTGTNNKIEQINMNAKNINDSIHKIKVFFERIERHLDLKK